jgi:8-oxo-dGTP pyrophosphatase MutT (NUDIX family)
LRVMILPGRINICIKHSMISTVNRNTLDLIKDRLNRNIYPEPGLFSTHGLKNASVLIPFTIHDQALVIIFTRRTTTVNSHQGQVSFPGGMIEKQDLNPLSAAFRETEEEIGISADSIEMIGSMQPIETSTGFYIYPFVGFINDLNGIHKNLHEVDRIFCIPFEWLHDPYNLKQEDYTDPIRGKHKVWAYSEYDGEKVWGITALILKTLLDTIKK